MQDRGVKPPTAEWLAAAHHLIPGLSDRQITQLSIFRDRILLTNAHLNLTAIRDTAGIDFRLILESLRLAPMFREAVMRRPNPARVVDMGTGSGIPGIPLAIVHPEIWFTLVDATAKKVRFVNETIEAIGLANAAAVHGRIEELAHESQWRETSDIVTARAVGSLPTLLELAMPLLKVGGSAIFPKGAMESTEIDRAKHAANLLGGAISGIVELDPIAGCPVTHVALADKMALVADRYPRRSGLPAREPLGG